MTGKRLDSVLIKPAGPDCNMACGYCFYLHRGGMFPASPRRMSGQTLETLVRQAMEQSGECISFAWQGGEPTLMGLEFFERAVALQSEFPGRKLVANSLQTNGLLIDERWAEFLARRGFLTGLSLDGPRHVHDRFRVDSGGRGTWEKAVAAAKLLLDSGAPVNALSVINAYSADFPEEIYSFHKQLGLNHMQFIPCIGHEPGGAPGPEYAVTNEQLARFWRATFDIWLSDIKDGVAGVSVRFFDSLFYHYAGMEPPDCTMRRECGTYVVVEHNGDVFPCDFHVSSESRLGNIADGGLAEMLNSRRQREFGAAKAKIAAECESCVWLRLCRGGCPAERSDAGAPSVFCEAYKDFFRHAEPHFKKLAADWKAHQRAGA